MEADVIIMNENGIINGELAKKYIDYPQTVDGRQYLYNRRVIVKRAFENARLEKFDVSFMNQILKSLPLEFNGDFNSFQRWTMLDGVLFHDQMQRYSANKTVYEIARNKIKAFCVDSFDF